ncbi:hypothetical protein LUZ63_014862 [Rhynchospora breviuscula]|uniref:Uncharacterized protein n=1 Tax=Rhynchospora breviuscula TaxID=2022672 RepID=A0A9Q0CBA4_9POAL|nr:hypothetical protein LUZ63_014862 [Rhynchospora breviuscula]
MAMMSKTMDLIEGFVKEGSFKWVLSRKTSLDEEFEEMERSPSGKRKWIAELSPLANVIVGRCSRILDVSMDELQSNFEREASETIKSPANYARNFLEYSCLRALSLAAHITGHLADKAFRRLTFDMMLSWEIPSSSQSGVKQVDADSTVCLEAFCRIAPAIPTIAEVITCSNLFDLLSSSTGNRLSFAIYDKYLAGLDRAIKKMKSQSESALLTGLRAERAEKILEIDGTLTTQPVLEHVGTSAWPGRLTLTDHALYFETLKVVTYDKPKVYELAEDLKQVIKPELTGPWGSRLFDKAVMYKSIKLSEPVFMEFPELTGHSRRDYWLAIMLEIFYAHRFIEKYNITGLEREETILKASLGILRLQALQDLPQSSNPILQYESLLMFNLCDKLPGGDSILETLANSITSRKKDKRGSNFYSLSPRAMLTNLGVVSGSEESTADRLLVGDILVGGMSPLEKALRDSRVNYKKVELAQASVDGVKVDGLDTNLALMKELLYPVIEIGKMLLSLALWEDPIKSFFFCCFFTYIIIRGWIAYATIGLLLFMALFILLTKLTNQGRSIEELKVVAPPAMNTMEQLLAVQNAISQVEEFVQDGNIVLLKLRSLLMAVPSQATDMAILALAGMAICLVLLPTRLIILMTFLEVFTRYSPPRRPSTERWTRRLREWWFSIPAAPVVVEREREDKKKR